MGRVEVWQALHPNKFDVDAFWDLFWQEVDTCFDADVACCQSCYERYSRDWPGLVVSPSFRNRRMFLEVIYEGSRLSDVYTEPEFLEMCLKMGCPACGQPLAGEVWAFEPDFSVDKGFVTQADELRLLAERTPFLALRHPLARKVLREIARVAKDTSETAVEAVMYRARKKGTPREFAQFLPPPASLCTEGRYNHAGRPVLYLASTAAVAHAELGRPADGCLVGSVEIRRPQRILDFANANLASDVLRAASVSSLLAAPAQKEGWRNPEYSFSRFVADCAADAGFTAIRYPSVAASDGYNLVILARDGQRWTDVVSMTAVTDHRAR